MLLQRYLHCLCSCMICNGGQDERMFSIYPIEADEKILTTLEAFVASKFVCSLGFLYLCSRKLKTNETWK